MDRFDRNVGRPASSRPCVSQSATSTTESQSNESARVVPQAATSSSPVHSNRAVTHKQLLTLLDLRKLLVSGRSKPVGSFMLKVSHRRPGPFPFGRLRAVHDHWSSWYRAPGVLRDGGQQGQLLDRLDQMRRAARVQRLLLILFQRIGRQRDDRKDLSRRRYQMTSPAGQQRRSA